jgi:N-ethylmaleimide reductase
LHGAHGNLLEAFLRDGSNHRNRERLLLKVAKACADAVGADRVRRPDLASFIAGHSGDSYPQTLFQSRRQGRQSG